MALSSRSDARPGIRGIPYTYATLRIRDRCALADTVRMAKLSRWARLTAVAAMAALSPTGAVIGGAIDEHMRLGFTIWQGACRAAGFSLPSVISFTFQLLPN